MAHNRGEYTIHALDLLDGSQSMSIINFFGGIVIQESVYEHYVTGTLAVLDREDFFMNYAKTGIKGGQKIYIKYTTDIDTFEWTFLITDIVVDEITEDAKRMKIFLADESMPIFKTNISSAKEGEISSIVDNIMKGFNITADVQKTIWKFKYIFPSWSVSECLEFLERRAVSTNKNTAYKFYQNTNGWHFKSLIDMYNQAPKKTIVPIGTLSGGETDVSDFVYRNFSINEIMEYDEDIENGALGNTLYVFDPFSKSYTCIKKDAKYNKAEETYKDKIRLLRYQHDKKYPDNSSHIKDFVQDRLMDISAFERQSISLDLYGSKSNAIGNTLEVVVMTDERNSSGARVPSDVLTDKYLITDSTTSLGKIFEQTLTLQRIKS